MAASSRTKEWLDSLPEDSQVREISFFDVWLIYCFLITIEDFLSFQASRWEWTTEMEIELFEAVLYYKPAGLSRDFNVAFILEKLCESGKYFDRD